MNRIDFDADPVLAFFDDQGVLPKVVVFPEAAEGLGEAYKSPAEIVTDQGVAVDLPDSAHAGIIRGIRIVAGQPLTKLPFNLAAVEPKPGLGVGIQVLQLFPVGLKFLDDALPAVDSSDVAVGFLGEGWCWEKKDG